MFATRIGASACLVTVMAAAIIGCNGAAGLSSAESDPIELRIGTLRVSSSGGPALFVGLFTAEPLVSVGWDGRPVLRLAESVELAADGLSMAVTLRPNVRFHTGEPVTATAVRELLLPKLGRRRGDVADVVVQDVRTLSLRLQRPHVFKVEDLYDFIVDDDERPQLRTGPFRVVSRGETVLLEAFAGYYRGPPAVKRIEVHEYGTLRAAWTAMMRDELNFLHEVNRDAIDFIAAGGDIRGYPMLRPYYISLAFNVEDPILRPVGVRLALSEAIDREEIVRTGMRGYGEAAQGPFWPYHWAYEQAPRQGGYNPRAAQLRLDAMGLTPGSSPGSGMPARFRFTCLVLEEDQRFERIALVVQRQLFSIGVDMRLEPLPRKQLEERLASGDFQAFILEMANGRTLTFPYKFWHSGTSPINTGYSAADAALDRMRLASTDDEVRVAVADVMGRLKADPPAVFLVWPREMRAADSSLEIPYEPDRDVLGTLWQARWSPTGDRQ